MDLRDLQPGERLRAMFDERVPVQVEDGVLEIYARGEIEVDRIASDARLRGRMEAEVPLTCSRCLRDLAEHVRTELDEEFSLRPAPAHGQGELSPGDFVSWVGPELMLDITEVVRQHLQMAVPMAPLCRPDCRGLCPVCGANWNDERCEHQTAVERTVGG